MKKILMLLCIIFSTNKCYASSLIGTSEELPWNIVIYMEASAGNLYQAAFKNLNEIVSNAPSSAHIFVFLHTQNNTGWLYRISKNNMNKIADISCDSSVAETLINVMQQTILQGPAKHYGLILWNHGYGILSPIFDELQNEWTVPYDGPYNVSCSLKRSKHLNHTEHKGICVTNNETFLSNKDMVYAFDVICNTLLNGKKLAFCGMDLCKGAMIEHAYQLHNYTDYLIGSQECELVDGWPYDTILQILNDNPNTTAHTFAKHIVTIYNKYYAHHTQQHTYTLSALQLLHIQALKSNIDLIAYLLMNMMAYDEFVQLTLTQLRSDCKAFCDAPMYCDLHQWYTTLLDAINDSNDEYSSSSEEINILRQLLRDGLNIISDITVARCNGFASDHAHGCSIYFPQFAIDTSYITAPFARESLWLQFLEHFLA